MVNRLRNSIFHATGPDIKKQSQVDTQSQIPDDVRQLLEKREAQSSIGENLRGSDKKIRITPMSGIPTLQMSPAKFGKRICIKKPSYFELLALKDPSLVNGGTSGNNLARSYA